VRPTLTITEPTMTRFLMSLDQSVGLVLHAFSNATSGDLFVWKAPATTVETLARAVASVMGVDDPEIAVIGSRHGEKLHETLLSVEEMVKSQDEGEYFPRTARRARAAVRAVLRGGRPSHPSRQDFTSANTTQLDLEATKELLLTVRRYGRRPRQGCEGRCHRRGRVPRLAPAGSCEGTPADLEIVPVAQADWPRLAELLSGVDAVIHRRRGQPRHRRGCT